MCLFKRKTVVLDVCESNAMLPNEHCPSIVKRKFYVSEAPIQRCSLHKEPIIIPPEEKPKVRVYVGVYDLQVATGDVRKHLTECKINDAEGIRCIADCQWNWQGTRPYEYATYDKVTAERIRYKDPLDPKNIQNDNGIMTLVRESGARFPLFDYTKPRDTYWENFWNILSLCKELGLTAWIVMTDFCTLKTAGDAKYFSPWYCAVQRMLPGIQNGVWGEQMKPWFLAFYKQVWNTMQSIGCDYLIEDMNEGDALGWDDAFMLSWFTWSNLALKGLGIPKEKIATTVGRNLDKIGALCGIISPHQIGRPDQIQPLSGIDSKKILWSSDGFWSGTGPADNKGKHGPGLDVAPALSQRIQSLGNYGFEYLPRDAYLANGDRACVDSLDLRVVKAIAAKG